jgi:hypothetical protein
VNLKKHKRIKRIILTTLLSTWAIHSFLKNTAFFLYTFPTSYQQDHRVEIYDNKITHKQLEELLGFKLYGRYPDKFAEKLLTYKTHVKNVNPELLEEVRKIVWVDEKHNLSYIAKHKNWFNSICGKIIMTNESNVLPTFAHELAHAKHCNLDHRFYSKWADISWGTHRNWDILGFFRNLSNLKYPSNGIVTLYGSKNPNEDLAELVEDAYRDFKLVCSSSAENHLVFKAKLELLREYGFLSQSQYEKGIECLL